MKILFSDEKLFDIDGIYNFQNDGIWAVSRVQADKRGGVKQKRKFPDKVMVWFPRECHQSSFLMKEQSIMPDTFEKCFQWLSNTETTCWESIGHFNKMAQCLMSIISVQRQLSIIHRQGSLVSKQSRFKSSR